MARTLQRKKEKNAARDKITSIQLAVEASVFNSIMLKPEHEDVITEFYELSIRNKKVYAAFCDGEFDANDKWIMSHSGSAAQEALLKSERGNEGVIPIIHLKPENQISDKIYHAVMMADHESKIIFIGEFYKNQDLTRRADAAMNRIG